MVKFRKKVLKNSEKWEKYKKKIKKVFKFLISEKNVSTYAGAPKIAQE